MKSISNYTLLLFLFLFITPADAQPREYKGKTSVDPLQLEQLGDSLHIAIDFDIRGVTVDSQRSISLVPVLVAPGRSLPLPEVMVKGRANYYLSRREVELMTAAERQVYGQNPPYAIVKGYKSEGQKKILYRKVIAFEPWMEEARLDIREDLCGCGNAPRSLAVSQLVNRVQREVPTPALPPPVVVEPEIALTTGKRMDDKYSFIAPVSEKQQDSKDYLPLSEEGALKVYFEVSTSVIDSAFGSNEQAMKELTEAINAINNSTDSRVTDIIIAGFASPEGVLLLNEQLAWKRALALKGFLMQHTQVKDGQIHLYNGGENWIGLRKQVEQDNMKHKEEVLRIIDQVPVNKGREKQLMDLAAGVPFRYMAKHYFGQLRHAAYIRVYYEDIETQNPT